MPTPPPSFDPRTEKYLATLDPRGVEKFRRFIVEAKAIAARLGCEYIAISGNRTWEEQDNLYAQGRTKPGKIVTKAKAGQSNHNFGIALDFGVFRGGRYLDDSSPKEADKVHAAVAAHAAAYGLDAGHFWKFQDSPHFEIATGLTLAQKRTRYAKTGSVLA